MISRVLFILLVFVSTVFAATGPIHDSTDVDYQPAVIRVEPDQRIMVVFERLDASTFLGDLLVTFSSDNGLTWTMPQAIISSPSNERAPTLVQTANGFVLLFLSDSTGGYRIHRASSPDGASWTDHGAVNLGWATTGEINPCVIAEEDGTLTMTYHRLSGPAYIAQSTDEGASWDTLKTQVSNSNGALPRLVKRATDGLYVVTYQTGSTSVDIWSKASNDPYDWSVPQNPLSTAINSHDPGPMVLNGGTILVTYAQQVASVFDLHYRTSRDGVNWTSETRITEFPTKYDTQPHPLLSDTPGQVMLFWSHQESASAYVDHDVWLNPELEIPMELVIDEDRIVYSTGGTVNFNLDAGQSNGSRNYLLLAGVTGTVPGYPLPGGTARLPLNWDPFTDLLLGLLNTPLFSNFMGKLDGAGTAAAQLNAPPLPSVAQGVVLYFAYALNNPFDFASNPVEVMIIP